MIKERVCYAVVFAVEAATAWFYYSSIYAAKRNRTSIYISFFLGYLLLFLLSGHDVPGLNLAMFFVVNLVLLLFFYI